MTPRCRPNDSQVSHNDKPKYTARKLNTGKIHDCKKMGNGSILNAVPSSATIVSNTSNTITIEIIGDPGELIGLIVPVFYGYDPSVDRVAQLDQFSIAFTINEPPEITAQLEVNPDINNDGFANTYEDSLNIVITNDADLDDHNWTITPKPIME